MRLLATLATLAWASTAAAQQLTYTFDEAAMQSVGLDSAQIEADLNGALEGAFDFGTQQAFLDSMAAAAALSAKGAGVDYATSPKRLIFGGGIGASTAGAGASFGSKPDDSATIPLPENGVSVQITLMAGLNLGILNASEDSALDRLHIFVNGMSAPLPNGSPFGGNMYNIGAHAQFKLAGKPSPPKIGWGGLDLTTGYEHSTYRLTLSDQLPVGGSSGEADLLWDASGDFVVQASAQSVPIELSTSVRLGVAALWLGGAVDMNTAVATESIQLGGPITAEASGESAELGTVKLEFDGEGESIGWVPRVFGGVQANILMIKVYGQLNYAFNDSFGGHLGLRVVL
ncbi:MAG: hypothetical protein ACI8PZ_003303 [Myxococcota bacterium]|jgi:hypothetical protein